MRSERVAEREIELLEKEIERLETWGRKMQEDRDYWKNLVLNASRESVKLSFGGTSDD